MPLSYCVIFVDTHTGEVVEEIKGAAETNVMSKFYSDLLCAAERLEAMLMRYEKVPDLTEREYEAFSSAKCCHICEKPLTNKCVRVVDHCHFSNRFLGAAHQQCNLNRGDDSDKVPVFMHNLSNFDSHLLVSGLKDIGDVGRLKLAGLPFNSERFRTIEINNLSFVDSLHFLSGSLGSLVDDLMAGGHDFPLLRKMGVPRVELTEERLELITRKGFFPYEWVTSLERLQTTKSMPPRQEFHSVLRGESISTEDWLHAKRVFDAFRCENMEEYMMLYLRTDVYLLGEVFLAFCQIIHESYGLHPSQYISLPQLSWDLCLKSTGSSLLLSSDPDFNLLPEVNIRGGLSFAGLRYADVRKRPDSHILYVDANNLYGCVMMQNLPCDEYQWLTKEEMERVDWLALEADAEYGYLAVCDLDYPEELHERHNAFPLAAETTEICYDKLSSVCKKILTELRGESAARNYKAKKLCATLEHKRNYVCHGRNLQFYLQQGLILKKLHRVMRFRQGPVFAGYVQDMADRRKLTNSPFQKRLWKLCVNSIFGKTLTNARKWQHAKFANRPQLVERWMSSPVFDQFKILDEDLVLCFMKATEVKVRSPFVVGFSILELSKLYMSKLYFEVLAPKLNFPELCFTDTDSFCMKVDNISRERMMSILSPIMDFSNYPKNHDLYSDAVKAVPGYIKDESAGERIEEVVSLRSKCYVIRHEDLSVKKTCKGVTVAAQRDLHFEDYLQCLTGRKTLQVKVNRIGSKDHRLHTLSQFKSALSSFDDKRYILDCRVHTRAYGHVRAGAPCEKCAPTRIV